LIKKMSSSGFDPRSLPPGFTAAPPGGGGGGPRGGGGGGGDGGAGAEAKQDEQRQMMLTVMLTPAARERLNRVALVVRECGGGAGLGADAAQQVSCVQRPDNARLLEGHLMKMLQTRGAPAEKVR